MPETQIGRAPEEAPENGEAWDAWEAEIAVAAIGVAFVAEMQARGLSKPGRNLGGTGPPGRSGNEGGLPASVVARMVPREQYVGTPTS